MNIIEREIAKRQEVIDNKAEKIAKAEELRTALAILDAEIAQIDTDVLAAEIEELKTFLPKEDVADEPIVETEPIVDGE